MLLRKQTMSIAMSALDAYGNGCVFAVLLGGDGMALNTAPRDLLCGWVPEKRFTAVKGIVGFLYFQGWYRALSSTQTSPNLFFFSDFSSIHSWHKWHPSPWPQHLPLKVSDLYSCAEWIKIRFLMWGVKNKVWGYKNSQEILSPGQDSIC